MIPASATIRRGSGLVKVDVAPGADVPIYEMVPISEIASLSYF